MATILIFGAGKSATYCINYLAKQALIQNFTLIVADANKGLLNSKTKNYTHVITKIIAIENTEARQALINQCNVCISLLPPQLHNLVALDCLQFNKHLATASYADDTMKALHEEALKKGLTFLCEIGLDPGLDHMSAMELVEKIKAKNGQIKSFISHCGGLVAPESDNNPWHYKISWNPKNIVTSGKAGAIYKQNGNIIKKHYSQIFETINTIETLNHTKLAWYANRDSLSYMPLYNLNETETFLRTTLRYPNFISGWQKIVTLNLTNEAPIHNNTLFIAEIINKYKNDKQLQYLLKDVQNFEPQNSIFSSADVLQFLLEQNLVLQPTDKDAVVMHHEIIYENNNNQLKKIISSLTLIGQDSVHTAMAKTVGIPLALGALLILNNNCPIKGVTIPIYKQIYAPVLKELKNEGIIFEEMEVDV